MAFDPEQLSVGTEVELEHTSDRFLAAKIAKDHLAEDPKYYSKLHIMEHRPWVFILGDAIIPLASENPKLKILAFLGAAAAGYHGWKRDQTFTRAVGWGAAGLVSPLIVLTVAATQGFGKKK